MRKLDNFVLRGFMDQCHKRNTTKQCMNHGRVLENDSDETNGFSELKQKKRKCNIEFLHLDCSENTSHACKK